MGRGIGFILSLLILASDAAITLSNLFGIVGSLVPLVLGFLALKIGLENILWMLIVAPIALLIGLIASPKTCKNLQALWL
ncbi:MAG: hypothetical protein AAF959_08485 [Cyanobacteria bacterium P01_D01_bin.56]